MKLVTFRHSTAQHLGVLVDGNVIDLSAAGGGDPAFSSMLAFAKAGDAALDRAVSISRQAEEGSNGVDQLVRFSLDQVRLLAPIPRPEKNVYCVGLNFRSHVEQNAVALGLPSDIPTTPLFFSKPVTAVIGPGDPIVCDARLTEKLDYEVELAVVIGKGGTWIPPAKVHEHILGFTLLNDVSARDLQWRTSQFLFGKGQDTYCPIGPVIVTRDELGSLDSVLLELYVNRECRQRESAGNMLFPPEVAIAELSKGITLEPGDVISLGTPGGCGYQLQPPRFLQPGDVVECRASVIGSLVNPVMAAQDQALDVSGTNTTTRTED